MGEYLNVCSRGHSGLIRLVELITLNCWTEFCNRHRFHMEEHVYYSLSRRLAPFYYKKAIIGLS